MPLPFILGAAAAVAGVAGVGNAIHGGVKMKEANDTIKSANLRHNANIMRFEADNEKTTKNMDALGKKELEILDSFKTFADIFERIQNRPEFKEYDRSEVKIPKYDAEKLRSVYVGAGALLGSLGGAAMGTAGGFAAAGATTSAVMAFGTASTGTAISTLSGAALTNATLAALGGGSLAAGGGGIALGTTILGAATLGAGILVGGIIFNITGCKLSDKADEAWSQMLKSEKEIKKICSYLSTLNDAAIRFTKSLDTVDNIYNKHLKQMADLVVINGNNDWNTYNERERRLVENTTLLVGLLYNMCKIQLVNKSENENAMNSVNKTEIDNMIASADKFLDDRGFTILASL